MLPNIQKRFYNMLGRPIISNSGYYTKNISAFLEYHLKPIAEKLKQYINDIHNFLRKSLHSLPEDIILCTIDIVGLYSNISHKDRLLA